MIRRRLKSKVRKAVGCTLLIIGYYFFMIPGILNNYSKVNQYITISDFDNSIQNMSQNHIDNTFDKLLDYNNSIYSKQQIKPYEYSSSKDYDNYYLDLPVKSKNEICTIIIKKIGLILPVGHGTDDQMLLKMGGHLYGTSLPSGGKNTHAVIAGHSGLKSSEMFTHLNKLSIDDEITVKILNKNATYKVIDIKTVLPDECNQYMRIVPGKDLITLYTCTPYGINTHRLLVTAERVLNNAEDSNTVLRVNEYQPMFYLILQVILPFIVILIVYACKYIRKERYEKDN